MKKYHELQTGQFADLCRITKKTLFYYEKIELLKPVRTDPNGYRVYTIEQCDKVSTIKMFQQLGMSIKDIQNFFQAKDGMHKVDFMVEQRRTTLKKIDELQKIHADIQFLLDRFEHLQQIGPDVLFEETLAEAECYHLTEKDQNPHQSVTAIQYGRQYGILFEQDQLAQAQPDYSYIFQRSNEADCNFRKPQGNYLCIYKLLRNEEMIACVPDILRQMQGYDTTGPLFHEEYCSALAGSDDQFVIKFSIKLC